MSLRNIRLTLQYDGTSYHGWQAQKGSLTIQEVVQTAIQKMTGEQVSLSSAGRTDAGVHAIGQVATFFTNSNVPVKGFLMGLNSLLPPDISVLDVSECPFEFHARKHALRKLYNYHLILSSRRLPLFQKRAWVVREGLNVEKMRQACQFFLGTHDFTSLKAAGSSVKTSVRTILDCKIDEFSPNFPLSPEGAVHLLFSVVADGFLRYMVRNIVGLLYEIGIGKLQPEDVINVIAAKDRSAAGMTAPAQGLYLAKVFYD